MSSRRPVSAVVLSDVHLGTFGCHARELLAYLHSIEPEVLILNGDIIDIWSFKKSYFPKSHFKVLKRLISMAQKGSEVYYITGNHDEMLRRFADADLGRIHLRNKMVFKFGGVRTWIFHGDIFDASIQNARWLAKLGGFSYDLLIWLNHWLNVLLKRLGRDHQPQMRTITVGDRQIEYLNSGDWIENLTALEWDGSNWTLYQHQDAREVEEDDEKVDASARHLLSMLLNEADSDE